MTEIITGPNGPVCGDHKEGYGWCSKPPGHRGKHAAHVCHDLNLRPIAEWGDSDAVKKVVLIHVDNGVEFHVKSVARVIEVDGDTVVLRLNQYDTKGTTYHGVTDIRVDEFYGVFQLAYELR